MVVTIEPDQGERYQSLVPIESSSLAGASNFTLVSRTNSAPFFSFTVTAEKLSVFYSSSCHRNSKVMQLNALTSGSIWSRWHKRLPR